MHDADTRSFERTDRWSPALQIRTVLLSIQALLSAPNPVRCYFSRLLPRIADPTRRPHRMTRWQTTWLSTTRRTKRMRYGSAKSGRKSTQRFRSASPGPRRLPASASPPFLGPRSRPDFLAPLICTVVDLVCRRCTFVLLQECKRGRFGRLEPTIRTFLLVHFALLRLEATHKSSQAVQQTTSPEHCTVCSYLSPSHGEDREVHSVRRLLEDCEAPTQPLSMTPCKNPAQQRRPLQSRYILLTTRERPSNRRTTP